MNGLRAEFVVIDDLEDDENEDDEICIFCEDSGMILISGIAGIYCGVSPIVDIPMNRYEVFCSCHIGRTMQKDEQKELTPLQERIRNAHA